jgi:hypothetical protein
MGREGARAGAVLVEHDAVDDLAGAAHGEHAVIAASAAIQVEATHILDAGGAGGARVRGRLLSERDAEQGAYHAGRGEADGRWVESDATAWGEGHREEAGDLVASFAHAAEGQAATRAVAQMDGALERGGGGQLAIEVRPEASLIGMIARCVRHAQGRL